MMTSYRGEGGGVVCLRWHRVVEGGAKEGCAVTSLSKQRGETKKGKQGSAWARHVEKKRRGSVSRAHVEAGETVPLTCGPGHSVERLNRFKSVNEIQMYLNSNQTRSNFI
jgi:hypothetical protein